jgi:hypothetical protein
VIVAAPTGIVYEVLGGGHGCVPYEWPDLAPELLDRFALDESRLAEADEAWVPVFTPDGPGVLTWENSDRPGLWGSKMSHRLPIGPCCGLVR